VLVVKETRKFTILCFLEDNLMRLFGSEKVAKVMDRMGLEEGEVIQHSMMTIYRTRTEKSRGKQLWCS
jgi:preprotein translocase subunit SecA